ncbi:MAG: hypothetical protein QOI69_1498, partial [Pseudonocardiales bacterium]|nr:hypothetical protein [Pseudonocardiales bacterium]
MTVTAPEATRADTELRSQLSDLQCLLMLSMLMTESGDEGKILQLAATSVPSFGHTHLIGVRFTDGNWWGPGPAAATEGLRDEVQAQVALLDASGGAIAVAGQGWTWA